MPCEKCGGLFHPDEIFHTQYRGDGGIGVQYDNNLCEECAGEEHDEWCDKDYWPSCSIEERVELIQKHNIYNDDTISVFAARHDKSPCLDWSQLVENDLY